MKFGIAMCIYTSMLDSDQQSQLDAALDVARCTCANLRKTTRAVTQFYDAALKPAGLTPSQFTLLAALARRGGVAQSQLAEALVMDRTTLIRNLGPLVGKGLIATETTSAKGVKTLSLTDEGSRVLQDALPRWQDAQTKIVGALGQERWQGLMDNLRSTIDATQSR